jgi:hypothetical protein
MLPLLRKQFGIILNQCMVEMQKFLPENLTKLAKKVDDIKQQKLIFLAGLKPGGLAVLRAFMTLNCKLASDLLQQAAVFPS